jgi:hypothetical protein
MTDLSGHSKLDVKIVAIGIILSCGVAYAIYSTVRHFYVLNQVNEAKEMMSDIQSLLVWSMHQHHDDVTQACHLKYTTDCAIRRISKYESYFKITGSNSSEKSIC